MKEVYLQILRGIIEMVVTNYQEEMDRKEREEIRERKERKERKVKLEQ